MTIPGGELREPRVRTPPPPGSESAGPSFTELIVATHETAAELRRNYALLRREWTLFRESATAVSSSAAATVNVPAQPLPQGFEIEVERLSVTVGGASAAATFVVFRNGVDGAPEDLVAALVGNTPSRLVRSYNPPIRLQGGEFLTVVFAAVAAGSNDVTVRLEGRKREP